jgi:formylglycine-generating enzyme required for sulfatase activity
VPFDVRLEAANALGQAGDPRIDEHAWITFPAGSFLMGGQSAEPNSEGFDAYALLTEAPPQHIQLNSFCIARFPVTVQEFRKFIDAGGYHEPRFWQEGGFQKWDEPAKWESQVRFPNHPITGVSWFEAVAYCQWLGDDMALPTEAQWERAARGLYDRRFPWGQSPPNRLRCNFRSIALDGTTPIGFFQGGETPEGISDMSGNVFEWCSDTWRDYTQSETIRHDNQTADDLSSRIVRGGSYRSTRNFLRAAFRGRYPANFQGNDVGFRLCRNKLP